MLIDFALKNKINYIAIDLSNNGTQKDQPVTELLYSNRVKDVQTIIDFANTKYESPIVLIGSSLGGFVTLNAGRYSGSIKGIILNCAPIKAHICLETQIAPETVEGWKTKGVATWGGVPYPYQFYLDAKSLNATAVLYELKMPILWFHGTDDMTVPISQPHEAKSIKPDIDLIEIQGGGHRFDDKISPQEYERMIEDFILKLIQDK